MGRVDPEDPRPPYHQIADDIRQQVASGTLTLGERLPSIRELASSYGVAQMTVHQAIRVLRDEGVLASYQGRGVFVDGEVDPAAVAEHTPSVDGSAKLALGFRRRFAALEEQTTAGLQAVGAQVESIEQRLAGAENRADVVAELRQEVADLRAHLIELYARTGHQYPRGDSITQAETKSTRRRASGA